MHPNRGQKYLNSAFIAEPVYLAAEGRQFGYEMSNIEPTNFDSGLAPSSGIGFGRENPTASSHNQFSLAPEAQFDSQLATPAVVPWLWSEEGISTDFTTEDQADSNMDMDEEVNWYNWTTSAKNMECDGGTYSSRPR